MSVYYGGDDRRRTRPSVVAAKTRLCQRFVRGNCTSQNCTFAHGDSELRKKPDLRKTKLCDAFTSTRSCPKGVDCTYAHGHHELQSTSEYFKTSLCPSWKQGHCQSGEYCRHAHGFKELRTRPAQDSTPSTTTSSFYDTRGMTADLTRDRPRIVYEPRSPIYDIRHSASADDDLHSRSYRTDAPLRPSYSRSFSRGKSNWAPRQSPTWRPARWDDPYRNKFRGSRPITQKRVHRGEFSGDRDSEEQINAFAPLTPVREFKCSEETVIPKDTVLTDEDQISSRDSHESSAKRVDAKPKQQHTGGRSSSVHVCAGAPPADENTVPYWNRWSSRAASAFYTSTPGSRRQSKQSILCIDLSDSKPAAADAYPLAALVGRHMEGGSPQSNSKRPRAGQGDLSPQRKRLSDPPETPQPEPQPAPTWIESSPIYAQGVPMSNVSPGWTAGLPVQGDEAPYAMPFLVQSAASPEMEEMWQEYATRPLIALSPSGPVMVDPMTFRALMEGYAYAKMGTPKVEE